MKTVTIPFNEFMAGTTKLSLGAGIYPSPSFESGLDIGLVFFGGLAIVVIGLAVLEKFGVHVDSSLVTTSLSVLFWIGLVLLLILKNPLLGFIR